MKKRYFVLTAAVAASIVGIMIVLVTIIFPIKENHADGAVYHDAAAEYGTLTVGITKTAPVTLGVVEQTFDLDIGTWTGDDSVALQIEEVLVSAGQQVQKGTVLFRVTSDSVQNVRTILQKKILDTNRDCELLEAKQRELRLLASQSHDKDVMDGKYASVIYSNKRDALQKKAEAAKEAVDEKQDQVNENLLELTQAQQDLAKAQKYLKEAEAAVSENYDDRYRSAYYYTTYEKTRKTAQDMVDQLEKQIGSLTEKNELYLYEIDEAVRAYHQIVQDLEREKLEVRMDYDTEVYDSGVASEWYDIQMAGLDSDLQEARERYQAALQNIRRFDSCIVRGQILSRHNGFLSDIMVGAGSTVQKNDTLVILQDQNEATMNVVLSASDFLAVNPKKPVNISFADAPDRIYEGRIAEVSDIEYDSNLENPYYIVTVIVQGDVSGLCEGMSGDVTLMTNERKEVLYVPNKAIFWKGGRSYVKVRGKRGNIVEKSVTTGFSDGVYIEIKKGLSEGDVVFSGSGSLSSNAK